MDFSTNKTPVLVTNVLSYLNTRGVTFCLALVIVLSVLSIGCTPQYYRQKADREAYSLVRNSACDSSAALCDFTIAIDKRSRMYDPFDPDCEPMFQDDKCSHRLMHCVDCKKIGTTCKKCIQTKWAENPYWRQYLTFDESGNVFLNKETVMELALRHSREYQEALENVYLSAINVSNQRFRYDVQFFGGDSLFYTASGDPIKSYEGSELANSAEFGFEKKFATGAELLVSVANSITWQFAGADRSVQSSIINLNFVQPLLRNAGKKIVLEELTQSERNLLANVRQMVFYRQGFYSKILTGSSGPNRPSAGQSSPSANGASGNGGYYGLLAEQIKIQNQEQNLISLEDNVNQMDEQFNAVRDSRRTRLSVEEMRQQFYTSQTRLLQQKNSYLSTVEKYLVSSLGLPPDLPVKVQDPLLEQFQLISKRMTDLQSRTQRLLLSLRREEQIIIPDETFPVADEILDGVQKELDVIEHDYQAMLQKVPERIAALRALEKQVSQTQSATQQIDPRIFDIEQFKASIETIHGRFELQRKRLESIVTLVDFLKETQPAALFATLKNNTLADEIVDAVLELELQEILKPTIIGTYVYKHKVDGQDVQIPDENVLYRIWLNRVIDQLSFQILETALCQARVRLNSITLVPVNISAERAFEVAAENRLDWMNTRSSLVDSWRKIQVAANALKSDLSIQVNGSAGTIDNNGLKFDASNSQISVGVAWDSPMTRHTEQSEYRTQLIRYQQSRRDYYSYVDNVQSEIRDTIRLLQRNQIEFEIQRASIAISTTTVELAQLELIRPPQTPGQSNSDNNLAQRIITALEKLLDAQNSFLDMWIGYESRRMGLDLQMGTLQLDDRGHWIDPGPITDDSIHVSKTGSGKVIGVGVGGANGGDSSGSSVRDIIPAAPTLAPESDGASIINAAETGEVGKTNEVPPRPDNGSKIGSPASETPPVGMQVIEVKIEDITKPKQTKDAPLPPVCESAAITAEPQASEETELKPSYQKKRSVFNNGKTNVTFVQTNINTTPLRKENAPEPPEEQ